MMTGSTVEKGGPYVGGLWQHLADIGMEYCVVRVP